MAVFSLCTYEDFLSKMVLSYPPKIDDFEREEPWKIWKLVFMSPNQKNESGTNCWLTGPVKSAAVLSNEGNLKIFYNLEGIPMKALEARSDTEWFGWVKS